MEICEVQSIYWQDLFYFPQAREIKRFSLFFFKYLVHSKENSWIISRQAEILTYHKCINVGQQCGPNYWLCEWLEYLDITIHLKIMLCGLLYQLTPHAPSSLIYICCKRVYKGLKLVPYKTIKWEFLSPVYCLYVEPFLSSLSLHLAKQRQIWPCTGEVSVVCIEALLSNETEVPKREARTVQFWGPSAE